VQKYSDKSIEVSLMDTFLFLVSFQLSDLLTFESICQIKLKIDIQLNIVEC